MNSNNKVAELESWIADLEELSKKKTLAQDRYDQSLVALKELGYDSLESAQQALQELQEKRARLEEEADQLIAEFKVTYKDFIEV